MNSEIFFIGTQWCSGCLHQDPTQSFYCYSEKLFTTLFLKRGWGVYCFGENLTFSNCFILILRQKRVLFWYQWWRQSSEQKEQQQPFLLSSEKNKNFAQKQKHPKLLKQCHELKNYLLNSSQALLPKTTHEFIIKSKEIYFYKD